MSIFGVGCLFFNSQSLNKYRAIRNVVPIIKPGLRFAGELFIRSSWFTINISKKNGILKMKHGNKSIVINTITIQIIVIRIPKRYNVIFDA